MPLIIAVIDYLWLGSEVPKLKSWCSLLGTLEPCPTAATNKTLVQCMHATLQQARLSSEHGCFAR